ncbi:hypothetical protein CALCODRAFT_504565 [Calocera cornea HHB12733]|uniref:MYND-type domain-containing protein n=1 Tax=Calocera cornea HHB12733 TaxID=1353952 RepID=A0A165CC76_9BASI|nr:hypothetical protein CALCODRAFT_504565 [Calocera cornea HHB12733]
MSSGRRKALLAPRSRLKQLLPAVVAVADLPKSMTQRRRFGILSVVVCGDGDANMVVLGKDTDELHYLERCGRRGCCKMIDNATLFQCSRCKVVLYCRKAHQKEDWQDCRRPHKAWCYKTPW